MRLGGRDRYTSNHSSMMNLVCLHLISLQLVVSSQSKLSISALIKAVTLTQDHPKKGKRYFYSAILNYRQVGIYSCSADRKYAPEKYTNVGRV